MAIDMRFDAPIPGENFTSDTRNYPWHRPPEYTNPDDALEWISKKLQRKEGIIFVLTSLKIGLTVKQIVSTVLMKGLSQGKWTVDLSLIIAGPLSHMIVLLAKKENIEYDLGIDNNLYMPNDKFFADLKSLKETPAKEADEKFKAELKAIREMNKNRQQPQIEQEDDDEDEIQPMGFLGQPMNVMKEGVM